MVGVGTSREFGLVLDQSPLQLQAQSFQAALEDAGLERSDIDGLVTAQGAPEGVDYEEFAVHMGCQIDWAVQLWSHGRWASTLIAQAAMAVTLGLARNVAVVHTITQRRGYLRHLAGLGEGHVREAFRDMGGGHGEAGPYGLDTPGSATALVAQRYMDLYGATSEHLAAVPLASRKHARLNPMAIMRERELSLEEYLASPTMAGPFRLFDHCLRNEGSTCIIVTSAERARDLRQPPVSIAGVQGARASRDDFVLFSRPGLGIGFDDEPTPARRPPAVYAMAGVTPADVDALYVYDSFSSNLWMVLERFGYCAPGEAFEWTAGGSIELGGRLPVNTNGGLQSEAHLAGHGHLIEMARQLRGQAGARQVPGARVLQWATPMGDSVILTGG